MAIRHQAGQLIERSGSIFVRFYDNTGQRVTTRLCAVDEKHNYTTRLVKHGNKKVKRYSFTRAVEMLRDQTMIRVNAEAGAAPKMNPRDLTIAEFWAETYLPWVEANLRASTVHGYKNTWKLYLEPSLGKRLLRDYKTHEGSALLTGLVPRLRAVALQHVRSLGSGIFTHAVNLGLIDRNPWSDVKVLAKIRASDPTKHYTLEEAENTITALVSRVDAQAIFACAFFLGLRPSEIAGLQWGDVEEDFIHIRRAAVLGVVGGTKTQRSERSLPLIQPVKGLLALWRAKCRNTVNGWVFPNAKNGPLNYEAFCRNVIIPLCVKEKVEWKGLYSARRGFGTTLRKLTGNSTAGKDALGHTTTQTTERHYEHAIPEEVLRGMKLLEAKTQSGDVDAIKGEQQ